MQLGIDLDTRGQVDTFERFLCVSVDRFVERVNVGIIQPQPGGKLMPAVFEQQIAAMRQRVKQVKAFDAPAGAFAQIVLERDQNRRLVEPVDNPRGDNADYAVVPVLFCQNEHLFLVRILHVCNHAERVLENFQLGLLALVVLFLQYLRDLLRALPRLRHQQFDGELCAPDPARRIDTRRNSKADHSRVDRFIGDTCRLKQRPKAFVLRILQLF